MGYRLGVDLGTTFTSAAVYTAGLPTMVGLGNRAMQVPSVLFLKPDGEFLVGEAAERRGTTDPDRVAREFKRRLGDRVPILVAGTPQSPQALQARLLSWVIAEVTQREGSAPEHITLTHPANWGPFKKDLFAQTIRMADVSGADICTEPEAAATLYAARNVLATGDCIAVYDLGGGTFDAAILRKTADGFHLLGNPEGIEHLGGIDFDEAVFQHVLDSLGGRLDALPDDDSLLAGLARLRRDCVEAKEALSSDSETVIPVALPGLTTSVRLVRDELENMIGPTIADTIGAMKRVIRSADLEPADLTAIVLTGGSSRIPLVSQRLTSAFDRPLALDTHPKHDVALGAALHGTVLLTPPTPTAPPPPPELPIDGPTADEPPVTEPPAAEPPSAGLPDPSTPDAGPRQRNARRPALLIGLAVVVIIAVAVVVVNGLGNNGSDNSANPPVDTGSSSTSTPPPTASSWSDNTMLLTTVSSDLSTISSVDLAGGPASPATTVIVRGPVSKPPHQPVIAPDRKSFVYLIGTPGSTGTAMLREFDGAEHLLVQPGNPCSTSYRPAYNPNGKSLAMICPEDSAGTTSGLFVIGTDGKKIAGPLPVSGSPIGDPTWLDDSHLLFLQKLGKKGPKRIYSIGVDGSDETLVDGGPDSRPDWCAGHGLLFLRNPKAGAGEFGTVMLKPEANQTSPAKTLDFGTDVTSATWSPSCNQIAYVAPDGTTHLPSLFIANADGSGDPQQVSLPAGAFPNQPAWGVR